jgi:hypothetical protein
VITEQDWAWLENDRHSKGATVRRVYPQSARDIFLAVRHPDGARMLTVRVSVRSASDVLRRIHELPKTRGIEMQFSRVDSDNGELRVILTDPSVREVFNPLATDIADTMESLRDDTDAIRIAVQRFESWRQMLQSLAISGLNTQSRRGLFGELSFLDDYLLRVMSSGDSVRSWTGPTGSHQDFQLPHAAIEVKTSSGKEPQTVVVSSERELDDTGTGCLILAHFSLDERRGGTGESLNTIIDRTRHLLADGAAKEKLDGLLVRAGYLSEHRDLYDEPRYTVRKKHFWHVTGNFPRITEADLRPGVGDCEYRISVAGLEQYLLSTEDVLSLVKEGRPNE